MRITLAELHDTHSTPITLLEIVSLEGQRYMVRLKRDGKTFILSDQRGGTRLFRGSWELQDTLRALTVTRAEIVHCSAYHEMVGLEPAAVDPLRIQLQRRAQ